LRLSSSLIRSVEELDSLKGEWDSLAPSFASPLFDHDWFATAARVLHQASDLRVFTVREDGRLVGVAPLVIDRSRGYRLTMIGSRTLYEPSGWIFESPRALSQLGRAVAGYGECVALPRSPLGCKVGPTLARELKRRAVVVCRTPSATYGVETTGQWDSYLRAMAGKRRSRLANLRERAEREHGVWDFSMRDAAPGEVESLIEMLIKVEGSGWKAQNGSALARRPDLQAFFIAYGRRAAERGRLRVSALRFGSAVAAMELAVEAYGRLWSLKIGYDEVFGGVAPGLQLAHATIQAAFERRLHSYEFLGVVEEWQERWKPTRRDYELTMIYPFSRGGMSAAAKDVLAALLGRRKPSTRTAEEA
jgi:CelD/BcsL family acetyltransferase involved in cellulose biosynthesis